jgi:hypothetical protein
MKGSQVYKSQWIAIAVWAKKLIEERQGKVTWAN